MTPMSRGPGRGLGEREVEAEFLLNGAEPLDHLGMIGDAARATALFLPPLQPPRAHEALVAPTRRARRCLLAATWEAPTSTPSGGTDPAGTAPAIGFVPSRGSAPH